MALSTETTGRGKLLVYTGRGRTGKTTHLRAVTEAARRAGRPARVVDCDRNNSTAASFINDAVRPSSTDDATVITLLENVTEQLMSDHVPVLLDLGGGDTLFTTFAKQNKLYDVLPKHGVDIVTFAFAAGGRDDLETLVKSRMLGLWSPMTALVLNEGLAGVMPAGEDPFKPLLAMKTVVEAIAAGAKVLRMPAVPLATMNLADRLYVGLRAAAEGEVPLGKDGKPHPEAQPLNFWRRAELSEWLAKLEQHHCDAGIHDWLP